MLLALQRRDTGYRIPQVLERNRKQGVYRKTQQHFQRDFPNRTGEAMRVIVCDECDGRITDQKLTFESDNETPLPPYEVALSVRTIEGSTKTSVDLCWDCFDRLREHVV